MDSLKDYVDGLFSKYSETRRIKDLKYEVLSNLEAKVRDLNENGIAYDEAIEIAKRSIESVDYLIDDNKKIYINKYKLEYVQIVLIYSLIAWILTIPMYIIGAGILINELILAFIIAIGVWYIVLYNNKNDDYIDQKGYLNIKSAYKLRRFSWIIWSLFILTSFLSTTAMRFGSNIWFSRPINISGPYQFAEIALRYLIPLVTVIIPACINAAPRLIIKYEVEEYYEK